MHTPEFFNQRATGYLPGMMGLVVTHVGKDEIHVEFTVTKGHMAPNGYLHAGSVVTLADSACGFGCLNNLPSGANGFTTIELKSNHLGTATEGVVACVAKAAHLGRTTQVWDAVVTHRESGKSIALFRCTQMILYPKQQD